MENIEALNNDEHMQKQQIKYKISSLHSLYGAFLVSGRDLACQQGVSLALTKTLPIHYYNVVDSVFSNYAELRICVSRDASVRKRNLRTRQTPSTR